MFDTLLPYLLAGISVGGQYALIAVGYTLVYGILRLINFAHGDIFTAAGFFMIYLTASLPIGLSIPLVIILTVVLGFTVERVAYKPLRSAPRMSIMISAIGVSYLLQNLMWYLTGGLARQYPVLPGLGESIRIGSAMAAIGSMLYFTNYTAVTPTIGAMPGLKAFVAAVFGGIGSIPGAMIGALIIGICENLIKAAGLTMFSDAFTFALLIVVLLVRPTGLFGEKTTEKV